MDHELQSRKKMYQEGEWILQWGYLTKGTFSIEEACKVRVEESQKH